MPLLTTLPPAALVPASTLVTNSSANGPRVASAMSQGPLMPLPESVSRTRPRLSRTIRQPADAVAAEPSLVGRLPTTTQPPRRISSAVVRPTPPGHLPGSLAALIWANTLSLPFGETWTIVVPVPWRFFELLKLLIRTSPLTSEPWFLRTSAMPYGLTSPLAGHGRADRRELLESTDEGSPASPPARLARRQPAMLSPQPLPRRWTSGQSCVSSPRASPHSTVGRSLEGTG